MTTIIPEGSPTVPETAPHTFVQLDGPHLHEPGYSGVDPQATPMATWEQPAWATEVCVDGEAIYYNRPLKIGDGIVLQVTAADFLERDEATGRITVWREGPTLESEQGPELNPAEVAARVAELCAIVTGKSA